MTLDDKVEKNEQQDEAQLEKIVNEGGVLKLKNGAEIICKNHKRSNPLFYYLGQVLSTPVKLAYLNRKMGTRPDPKSVKLLKEVVENDPDLAHARIRLGHDSALGEVKRLWTDPYIRKTRSLVTKILGTPSILVGELIPKFLRADHTNPWTGTMVSYSPLEAAQLSNAGQLKFFERRKYKLPHILTSLFGVGKLYLQPYAAMYANRHLPRHMRAQTGRYIFPMVAMGFATAFGFPFYYGAAAGLTAGFAYNKIKEAFKKGFPEFFKEREELRKPYELRDNPGYA